ncbi:HAD-IA family hydrolase [Jannaschia aquimarina]|uniref:Phosphorylated carbohydrates phosphatase n=1 Tax=Jannaschia aquimarina TaxID=935700 RepID=A0A0D1EKD4_9RHOB|nr:HAD-IA family hydrolase [Jannaschia aquimarina]KIT17481.1 Phosphorylated carbohydrates phosphatase [Jannaschia aquimarina]SNS74941.1 haloacid dehalogenase superfamily, subfamily IA, variant 3 with third motif having DD or ED [Jannaschia aquimarina]
MLSASALFFGAIGTLAETTELQRRAYNRAFAEADLDWVWDHESYLRMLHHPGGRARLARYAEDAGDRVDIRSLHAAKCRHFAALVRQDGIRPRPGVPEMIAAATARGLRIAVCSTTSPDQIHAVLSGLERFVDMDAFEWIGDATHAARPKPAPDIYRGALGRMDLDPARVLAIEDTPEAAQAALDAGLRVLAFPGAAARRREFQTGLLVVDRLQPRLLDLGMPVPAE